MKKNASLRLKLNRETLGSLTSDDMGAAQGGALGTLPVCSAYRTCGCPPPPTQSVCPTCVQNCTALC